MIYDLFGLLVSTFFRFIQIVLGIEIDPEKDVTALQLLVLVVVIALSVKLFFLKKREG
ncbi:hypothetical protein D3C80_1692360 [compost metagenome]